MMVWFVYILLCISAAIFAVPITVFAVECLMACFVRSSKASASSSSRPSCVVLVPAHNEEDVLGNTLASLKRRMGAGDKILVIADNCNDLTAEIARDAGAGVVERIDLALRGKGYAMQFGIDALRAAPPEVLVFLDADCELGEGALDSLVARASRTGCVVQANYQMRQPCRSDGNANTKVTLSEFAILVKNFVRPRGMAVLGIPCHLTGSGMAFPWAIAESLSFATDNIVEDMAIGCEVILLRGGPVFCEDAEVVSPLPVGSAASLAQRRRWEHGHLNTLIHKMPRMFLEAWRQRRVEMIGFGLDMTIPPLTILVMAIGGMWLAAALFSTVSIVPLAIFTIELGAVIFPLAWVAFRFSHDKKLWPALFSAPRYVSSKIPLYFAFAFTGSQKQWVRTAREPLNASDANR